jgi:Flp pilus assembly protein TadG
MLDRLIAALRRQAARFAPDERASVVPIFTLALIPIVGLVGSAVDYSRASGLRQSLQAALDTAILAGARDGTSNWPVVALDSFNANIPAKVQSALPGLAPSFSTNGTTYSGAVTASVQTSFMGILGISAIPLSAQSLAAVRNGTSGQFCVLSLNRTAASAVQLNGNATIDIRAPQCTLQVNSSSSQAVSLNGNATITSGENCFVGSYVKVGNATITPAPDKSCTPVPDPFAKYARPTVGSCDFTNFAASGQKTITLQPGVYCGGMQFSGQVDVTFAPGLYVIKDGALRAQGGSSFTGDGVSFFMTGQGAGAQLSGQANWHLVAPSSGPFPGFVFFLDPSGPSGLAATASSLAGSAEMFFEGVAYFPQQQLTLSGGAQVQTPSPYTSYIADTITINGNGTLVINSDPTQTTVPIPSALKVTWNGQPYLVK